MPQIGRKREREPSWQLRLVCYGLFIRPSDLSSSDIERYEAIAAILIPIVLGFAFVAAVVIGVSA